MAITTTSNTAFIEQQIYSEFVLKSLETGLLPDVFYREVGDFGSGDTLNIPTIGEVTIQDISENEDPTFNPIDTNRVTLTISEEVGDAYFITDNMRENGYSVEQLIAERGMAAMRAFKEYHQSLAFSTLYNSQTAANPNNVNGFAHRRRATGGNEQLALADLADMALAFDKANVPQEGRIAIVDPVVATTIEKLYTVNANVDANPTLQAVLEAGMSEGMRFRFNLYGWNIFVSNLLPDVAAGTSIDGTASITNAGKANLFMSVIDDQHTPLMHAWRRQPSPVGPLRDDYKRRDDFMFSARFGFGAQRQDTLGVIVTDAVATA